MRAFALLVLGVLVLALAGSVTAEAEERVPLPPQPAGVPWPTPSWPEGEPDAGVDRAALVAAMDTAFESRGRAGVPNTRALLVVQRGRIVAERYAPGFGPESRFQSWSMAKSVTLLLVGTLVRQHRLALDARAPVPAWSDPADPRHAITLRHLLQMTSGLDNADGGVGAETWVGRLLFGDLSADTVAAATGVPLAHPVGTHWAYSTGTSAILSGIVGRIAGPTRDDKRAFVRRALLEPLGIRSLIVEFDAADNLLGGSSVWAPARDWARLGLLVLRDGRWDGRRVLPEGFVDFARTPAPAANNGTFGAHLWLNRPPAEDQFVPLPGGPETAFQMSGAAGQYVVLLPTRDLIVVRLGEMQGVDWPEVAGPVAAVAEAFPPLASAEDRP